QETAQALTGIKEVSAQTLALIDGIELATREQSGAANEISRNIEQIAQKAEESASAVLEIAHLSSELAEVTLGLNESLARVQV
ncbi:MAG TPA: PAS domain S-box protein, partial [Azoarcus sp.]|nr:PAS domain S-box protein [Azoarcus sp.]